MLTKEEATALLNLLDRTPITGHSERQIMNIITAKLDRIINPLPEEVGDMEAKKKKGK